MIEPTKFRRRPETVEALQYDGTDESRDAILLYFPDAVTIQENGVLRSTREGLLLTLDWIVRHEDRTVRKFCPGRIRGSVR